MKPRFMRSFSFLVAVACLTGCASPKPALPPQPYFDEKEAIGLKFPTYEEAFRFIAQQETIPMDDRTVFRLAADSRIEILRFGEHATFYLVEANLYGGGIYNRIRGAQFNGRYYVLRSLSEDFIQPDNWEKGFELVGILSGNRYEVKQSEGKLSIVTSWHSSLFERGVFTYVWDGKSFPLSEVQNLGARPESSDEK
jgi:hypothetical protein